MSDLTRVGGTQGGTHPGTMCSSQTSVRWRARRQLRCARCRELPLPKSLHSKHLTAPDTPSRSHASAADRSLRKRIAPATAGCQVSPRIGVQESRQRPRTARSLTRRLSSPRGILPMLRPQAHPADRSGLRTIASRIIGLDFSPKVDRTIALQWRNTRAERLRTSRHR